MSGLYNAYKEGILGESFYQTSFAGDTFKVTMLGSGGGTFNAANSILTDVSANKVAGITDEALSSPTKASGVFDNGTATTTVSGVTGGAGNAIHALVIYDDSKTNKDLMVFIDQGTGLADPLTPSGNPIDITWSGSGIFSL